MTAHRGHHPVFLLALALGMPRGTSQGHQNVLGKRGGMGRTEKEKGGPAWHKIQEEQGTPEGPE